jgi:hypothetical protein
VKTALLILSQLVSIPANFVNTKYIDQTNSFALSVAKQYKIMQAAIFTFVNTIDIFKKFTGVNECMYLWSGALFILQNRSQIEQFEYLQALLSRIFLVNIEEEIFNESRSQSLFTILDIVELYAMYLQNSDWSSTIPHLHSMMTMLVHSAEQKMPREGHSIYKRLSAFTTESGKYNKHYEQLMCAMIQLSLTIANAIPYAENV